MNVQEQRASEEARKEYMKNYRKANADKFKVYQQRYWLKRSIDKLKADHNE
jgi:uncharacterized protein YhbP (UPF0306 family)